jgi:hypothetical protein
VVSKHAEVERLEEDIDADDIETCVHDGFLLEDYPEDPRGRSCLVAGYADGRWLHIVCGRKKESVIIITVYVPKPPYWETPTLRGDL